MKQLILLYFLFSGGYLFSQDTLYLPVPALGRKQYVLYQDGSFIYNSNLCGQSYFSYGDYKKNIFGYTFSYDSTRCPPKTFMTELKSESPTDSLTLMFFDISDSTSSEYIFEEIQIGYTSLFCDSSSVKILKSDFDGNRIQITSSQLTFNFDSLSSVLKFYISPFGSDHECGSNDLKKLRKTSKGYLQKSIVYDEIKGKPWEKGTRRVVREYYQLRKESRNKKINTTDPEDL